MVGSSGGSSTFEGKQVKIPLPSPSNSQGHPSCVGCARGNPQLMASDVAVWLCSFYSRKDQQRAARVKSLSLIPGNNRWKNPSAV
ncbi:hypothetical protein ZHAS_00017483 [Anopheles sinensis]|uniref:Uncharacterized protein n=1 Tax=Anopheles sinensis TaxID=74873 RepID=A0A084WGP0_ANOSI|nr:hypothetical protein ZHAS_00017483 [Anopheles sinensis]